MRIGSHSRVGLRPSGLRWVGVSLVVAAAAAFAALPVSAAAKETPLGGPHVFGRGFLNPEGVSLDGTDVTPAVPQSSRARFRTVDVPGAYGTAVDGVNDAGVWWGNTSPTSSPIASGSSSGASA